ncbi:MAG: hypothetical protein J6Y57_03775 [Lachnospiraceae bacterium]|nr:hypothetical protein [Lachnospiraceae bacterium]
MRAEPDKTEGAEESRLNAVSDIKSLFLFVLPAIIIYVFNGFYSAVDGAFIEEFQGPYAIAAVNLYYPVLNLALAIGLMIGSGGAVALASLEGKKEHETANGLFTQLILVTAALGVIIAVIGNVFSDQIVVWLGASEGNRHFFIPYYRVMVTCSPILVFTAILTPLFFAEGKTVEIAVSAVIGGVLNMLLDYVFMGPLKLGIAGAAAATMIGCSVLCIYALFFYLHIGGRGSSFRFRLMKPMPKRILVALYNGSSEMVTNLAGAVTALVMNRLAYSFFREAGVSVVSVYLYVQFMIMAVFMGTASAMEPLISYHYGAGNFERGRKIYRLGMLLVTIFTVVLFVIVSLFHADIAGIFFQPTGERRAFYELGAESLAIVAPACLFTGYNIYICGLFTAYGNGTVSAVLSVLRTLVFLLASLYLLSYFWSAQGLWLSWLGAEVPSLIVSLLFLFKYRAKYRLKRGQQ